MLSSNSDRVRGELLRKWRLAQQLELREVARRVNLSAAQIQQLETGATSLFYSDEIRFNAAKKVALVLGGDPDNVIRPLTQDDAATTPDQKAIQILDELIELAEQRKKPHFNGTNSLRQSMRSVVWLLGLVSLSSLSAAGTWLYLQPEVWKNWVPVHWVEEKVPELFVVASKSVLNVVDPAPDIKLDPGSVSAPVVEEEVPSPPAASAVQALSALDALCQSSTPGTLLTPKIPSKAGDTVYIVALKAGLVCARDGAGKNNVLRLHEKEGRSFHGPAPWHLFFEHADQVQVYFQGERLRLPEVPTRSVVLREVKAP